MSPIEIDTTRLPLLLHELRLPAIGKLWPEFAERSDKEGWPAARFLSVLAELEIAERGRRRIERHLAEARLPPGKTLENFDFAVVPMLSKARIMALAAGDTWLEKGANLLFFVHPASGKVTVLPPLAGLWWRMAIGCCSPASRRWCSGCRPHGRLCSSNPPSPSSTNTTS